LLLLVSLIYVLLLFYIAITSAMLCFLATLYCYILWYNSYMYTTIIAIIPLENHIYNITRLDSEIDFLHVFAYTPMLD
jgi:hypothetical protein